MYYKKIKTLSQLKKILKKLKQRGKKIVFTNGCFDILHRGHIDYLSKAKALGDVLIIGLNTDRSIRKLKGGARPIVTQRNRAIVLAALEMVDFLVLFDELTPLRLIKAIRPDVLVKGGDWKKSDIVGNSFVESYGGVVKTIPYIKGFSTTSLIKKIIHYEK